MVREISDSEFNKEVLNSDKPVVVDFWASWCGPCKMLGLVMEQVSQEMIDQANFVKVNVDENPITSSTYKIASIPTVMVFSKGKLVGNMVGFRPKGEIISTIKKYI